MADNYLERRMEAYRAQPAAQPRRAATLERLLTRNRSVRGYDARFALPELHLPLAGTEPNAFIVVCSTVPEDRWVDIDLGIAVQSMLLRAVEIGLNGLCIGAFDRDAIRTRLRLPCEPLLILAVGKSAERIERVEIGAGGDRRYYRSEGVHYVPKIRAEELIIDSDSAETGDKS